MILENFCCSYGYQTANLVDIWGYMLTVVMCYIHTFPARSATYLQLPFSPFDWCGVYWLARLASLDHVPYGACGHWQIGQRYEIARPSYTGISDVMVYFHYLVQLVHRSSAYLWYRLNVLLFLWGRTIFVVSGSICQQSCSSILPMLHPQVDHIHREVSW